MEDDTLVLVVDYEAVCRLCLRGGALGDLFASDAAPPLAQQLRALSGVRAAPGDGLPGRICHRCRHLLELAHELRTTALRSDRLLRDSVEAERLLDGAQPFADDRSEHLDQLDDLDNLDELIRAQAEEGDDPADDSQLDRDVALDDRVSLDDDDVALDNDVALDEAIADNEIELCAETGNSVIECKIELPENYHFITETERKDYVSSKDVTLDQVSFDGTETTQIQLLPDLSDDGGSITDAGLSLKLKDPSGNADRPSKQQTCQLCLTVFADRAALNSHIADHYKDSPLTPYNAASKPYVCQECNLNFSVKMDMISHHRRHLDINPFMCKVPGCNFDIRTREALRHHMYTHVVKKFVCNICGARYKRKIEILRHRVRHLDEGRQFRCGLCWVICKNRLSLKAHLKNHEIGRRFKCEYAGCPKAFFSNSDLVIHSRSHSNDKCYKCPLCVCAYTSQSQLNRHLRRHNKPGPTKCDKCSETFSDYGSFCNHRIATHGEWQPHRCKGCNQGYQSEQQLEKHLSRCDIALKMKSIDDTDMDMKMEGEFDDDQNNIVTR